MWTIAVVLVSLAASMSVRARAAAVAQSTTVATSPPASVITDTLHPHHPGVDVQGYVFQIRLPERGSEMEGVAEITLRRQPVVDTLRLDLLRMQVVSVEVGSHMRQFRRDSAQVHIPLQAGDGNDLRVRVRWRGAPTDGLIIREDAERGWSAFGDNWPNRARHWLATVDHPSDKATVQWIVSAPSSLAIVANGTQESRRETTGGYSETRFTMTQPIPTYLMVLGAARMNETVLPRGACGAGIAGACVPQSVWTFTQETSYAPGPFGEADRMIAFFARTAGAFPYERLAHVQSATRFGGMENATVIFYSDAAFRRRDVGIGLIAHETAHQWFGNAVTPRRWQDVWLSEGFASYWAPLYLRESQGDSVFRAQLRTMRETIIAAPIVAQRPVVDSISAATPMSLLNANSYQKGGWVLHMLRTDVGDSAFFGAVREYQRVYRHGTAITDNFLRIVERHAARSLDVFAAQWLHRPGWADLTTRARWNEQSKQLQLDVTQSAQFAPYAVTLTLLLRDEAGRESRVQVPIAAMQSQSIAVDVRDARRPVSIEADPDVTLLGRVSISYER